MTVGMDSYAFYLMFMITAQFETLHVHMEQLGKNIVGSDPSSSSYKSELRENTFSFSLCLKEHRLLLEFSWLSMKFEYFSERVYLPCFIDWWRTFNATFQYSFSYKFV